MELPNPIAKKRLRLKLMIGADIDDQYKAPAVVPEVPLESGEHAQAAVRQSHFRGIVRLRGYFIAEAFGYIKTIPLPCGGGSGSFG
jgi:hypothetical protein